MRRHQAFALAPVTLLSYHATTAECTGTLPHGGRAARAADAGPPPGTAPSTAWQALPATSSPRIVNLRFSSEMTAYDVASNICQAVARGATGDGGAEGEQVRRGGGPHHPLAHGHQAAHRRGPWHSEHHHELRETDTQ